MEIFEEGLFFDTGSISMESQIPRLPTVGNLGICDS